MFRTLGKIAGYAVLVLLLLAIVVYLARDPLRDAVIRTVSTQVSKALDGSIEISRLRGSLVSSLVLQDVVLRDQQGIIARLPEVRLRYDLWTLLQGQLTIEALDLLEPEVTLVQAADGSWNVQRLLPPSTAEEPPAPDAEGGLPLAIKLARLQIRDGDIRLQTPALPGVRHLEGLQLHLSGQIDAQGLLATLHQLTARAHPAEVDLQITGGVQGPFESLRLKDIRAQTQDSLITADGALPGGRSPANLTVQMQPLDVGEIGRLLDDEALRGMVRLDLQATGPPEALQMQAQLRAAEGAIDLQGQVDTTAQPLSYQTRLDITHVNLAALVDKAALRSDLNLQLRVSGAGLAPGDMRGQVRLEILPSHLGDIVLRPSLVDLEVQPQRFVITEGTIDTSVGRLTASGELNLERASDLQYALDADLAQLRQLLGVENVNGAVQARGEVRGAYPALRLDGQLQATALRFMDNTLASLRVTYAGQHLGDQPELTAHLVAQEAQIGTLPVEELSLRTTYQEAASQLRFTADVQQSATSGGAMQGTVSLTDAGQQVHLADLQVRLDNRLWQATAPIEVAVQADEIRIDQFRLAHGDEVLDISGALDGQALRDLTLRAEHIDLAALRQLTQLPPAVDGRATLHVQLSGTLPQPVLQTELRLNPAAPGELGVQQALARLNYQDKTFHADLRLQQGERQTLSLDASLPIDLSLVDLPLEQRLPDEPLALQVRMQQPELAALQPWLPGLPQLLGTLQGTIEAAGTYAELSLHTELELQAFGVKGMVEQVDAPLQLQGALHLAASPREFARALQQGEPAFRIDNLELQVPRLRGQLPGEETPQPLQIDELRLHADGRLSADGMQATLHSLRLQAQGFDVPQTTVQVAGDMTPQAVTLSQLQVQLPNSELHGSGRIDTAEQRVQLRLDIPRLRLDEFVSALPPTLPRVVQGEVEVTGSTEAPEVDVRLRYAGADITAELSAALQERLPRYNATVRISHLALAAFLPEQPGRLGARLRVQGRGLSGAERQATLTLDLDGTDVALLPELSSQMRVQLQGEAVQLEQFQVQSTPVQLRASGNVSSTRQVSLDYRLTLGDLAPLQSALGLEMQATGRLSGRVRGGLDALRADTDIDLGAWKVAAVQGQGVQGELTASNLPAAPQGNVQVELIEVQGPSLPPSNLRLDGNIQYPRGTMEVAVTSGPYDTTGLAGDFNLQDGVRLVLDRLRLKYAALSWENTQPVEIVRTQDGTLRLSNLALRDGAQEIKAQGTLRASGDLDAELHIGQLQVQPTVEAFTENLSLPDGRLTADFTASGSMQEPRLEGSLALTALQWQDQELGELRADLALADETLRTDLRWQDQGRQVLLVQGSLGTGTEGALDLQVKAPDFDLARLTPVVPAVLESSGDLNLDVRLTGALQEPLIDGDLTLRDGVLRLRPTGERYEDIQIRLAFAGERVDFEQFQAHAGRGTVQASGSLGRAGMSLGDVDVSVQADDFSAMNTPDIQAIISSDITVAGTLEEMAATGEVTVERARLRLSDSLVGGKSDVEPWELTVQGVYGPGPEAAPDESGTNGRAAPSDPLPFLRADLTVDIPRNAWIQGPDMAIELSGTVQITKDLSEPFILAGSIETVRGYATFYGKKFTLTTGEVTFTGVPEIDPLLDVAANYEKSDYLVTVEVSGRTSDPTIALSSDPPLEQVDIISLLVIGKTTDRLTASEQNSLSDTAQELAGGVAAKQLQQALGNTLGFDTIEVQSGDGLGTGRIGVGKYVTQDIFVNYETGIGEEEGNKVGVEYNINRRLKLKGSSSTTGDTAVDFLWEKNY